MVPHILLNHVAMEGVNKEAEGNRFLLGYRYGLVNHRTLGTKHSKEARCLFYERMLKGMPRCSLKLSLVIAQVGRTPKSS